LAAAAFLPAEVAMPVNLLTRPLLVVVVFLLTTVVVLTPDEALLLLVARALADIVGAVEDGGTAFLLTVPTFEVVEEPDGFVGALVLVDLGFSAG